MTARTLIRAPLWGTLFDTEGMRTTLRSAHIPIPAETYIARTLAVTALSCGCYAAGFLYLELNHLTITLFCIIPDFLSRILVFMVMVPGVFCAMSSYPSIVARGRKTRIDLDLPYALTYMQALSTTMTMYEVIRKVYEEVDLFGEVSREFGIIVRNVELFGQDLTTALRDHQRYTPSDSFRELLNDLVLLTDSGGDLTSFLAAKSTFYRDMAEREMELTLQIMAEVYVTAFVAGPIAVIILMVAQNLSGTNTLAEWLPPILVGIPAGALGMIWILHLLLPPENLEITRKEKSAAEFGEDLLIRDAISAVDRQFVKKLRSQKQVMKIMRVLRHPLRYYIADYTYGTLLGCICGLSVFLVWQQGYLNGIFPVYTSEVAVCFCIIAFMVPLSLANEGRRWYVRHIERQLPEFLRELADMKDIGMTLQGAIHLVSSTKLGVLSSELRIASEEIHRGSSIDSALIRMEERIGLVSVKRVISLVVKASEITDHIKDILMIAIGDLEHYLKVKANRFNRSFVYVMIIYLSFGIFLYTAYQLNVSFVSSFYAFENFTPEVVSNLTEMFWISIILGTFSGLMAGQFSSNSVLAGFKHTIIFLIATVIVFVVVLGDAAPGVMLL
jgi:flagellar protein FlaJ